MTDEERADDSFRCYEEAIRQMRLNRIRSGEYQPRPDDIEEMQAAKQESTNG